MTSAKLILTVAFLVFEGIAAMWTPPEPHRHRFIAAGLTCYAASLLF